MKAPAKPSPKAATPKPLPPSHTKPVDRKAIAAEKTKVMTAKQWETSATDAAMDRNVAKKAGVSLEAYEGSPLDERNDAKQRAAHNAAAKATRKLGKSGA